MTHSRSTDSTSTEDSSNVTAQGYDALHDVYGGDGVPEGMQLTPFDDTFRKMPYAVYRLLRERAPVHHGGVSQYPDAWVISNYEHAVRILQERETCVDPRKVGLERDPRESNAVTTRAPDMLGLDDPDHLRLRRLVQKAFTPKSVEAFRPHIEQIVDQIIADLKTRSEFDIVADFAKPVPTRAIAELFGVNPEDHRDFKRWTDILIKQGYPMPTEAQWAEILQADADLRDYFERIVAERRAVPKEDLVTALIRAKDEDDKLTEDEIISMCTLLIGAGNVTTTDLIGNGLLALFEHPDQMAKLRAEPELTENAVEEILRYDSSVTMVNRFVTTDLELGGKTIPAGCPVSILLGAGNHDPALCERPDAFDIERAPADHLTFGRGSHICLGAPLARLETQIAITKLLAAFPDLELIEDRVERRKMILFRGCKSLRVRTR